MANKRYDICAPRKGRDKTFWHRIGTAWEGDKGIQLVFDSLPLPDSEGNVKAYLFEPRDNNSTGYRGGNSNTQSSAQQNTADELEDSIPF